MTQQYTFQLEFKQGRSVKILVSYRKGRFLKLEHKSGKFENIEYYKNLMKFIPPTEAMVEKTEKHFAPALKIEKIIKEKPKTLYQKFMDEYFSFYERINNIKPRVSAVEGKSLKQIISHLQDVSTDDAEALATWLVILSNWSKLSEFYQSQMELRQINSNINIILRELKNGKRTDQAKRQANNNADDLRQSV